MNAEASRPNVGRIAFGILTTLLVLMSGAWYIVSFNWKFRYAFDEPYDAPNGALTDTGTSMYWTIFLLAVIRTSMLVVTVARSSNTRAVYLRYLLFVVGLLAIAGEIAACVIFFMNHVGCNNAPTDDPSGSESRFCNDFRWCCVYGPVLGIPPQNVTCPATSGTCVGTSTTCPGSAAICPISNVTTLTGCSLPSFVECSSNSTIECSPEAVIDCPPPNVTLTAYCPIRLAPCLPTVYAQDLAMNWVFALSWASVFIFGVLDFLVIAVGAWMRDGVDTDYYSVYVDDIGSVDSKMGDGDDGGANANARSGGRTGASAVRIVSTGGDARKRNVG